VSNIAEAKQGAQSAISAIGSEGGKQAAGAANVFGQIGKGNAEDATKPIATPKGGGAGGAGSGSGAAHVPIGGMGGEGPPTGGSRPGPGGRGAAGGENDPNITMNTGRTLANPVPPAGGSSDKSGLGPPTKKGSDRFGGGGTVE